MAAASDMVVVDMAVSVMVDIAAVAAMVIIKCTSQCFVLTTSVVISRLSSNKKCLQILQTMSE